MTELNLLDVLHTGVQATPTVFRRQDGTVHDRATTIGASALWTCERKQVYGRLGTAPDPAEPGKLDWGALQRGHSVESWVVEKIRAGLPKHIRLLYAGNKQKTLVDGLLSATPDGLLVWKGSKRCEGVEIKSIDPRYGKKLPKGEHEGQLKLQLALWHSCTKYRPQRGRLLYVNAADYSLVQEFLVEYDASVYGIAWGRAQRIALLTSEEAAHAEGVWTGECDYCPWRKQCKEARLNHIPTTQTRVAERELTALEVLATTRERLREQIAALGNDKERTEQLIKELLARARTNAAQSDRWNVSYTRVKGRRTLDQRAVRDWVFDHGGDLEEDLFWKHSEDSERLEIKPREVKRG